MRITALLEKIHDLAGQAENATAIDVDLMLDYTRVLYSDLLEWRKGITVPELPEAAPVAVPAGRPEPMPATAPKPEPDEAQPRPAAGAELHPAPTPSGMNGHSGAPSGSGMPLSSPGSPVVVQTSVQFGAAEPVTPPEPTPVAPPVAPKELTLEEYLARQREAGGETEDPEEGEMPVPVPSRAQQPVASHSSPAPVAPAEATAPAVTPLPAPPPPPRDIRTMIGINDKYQIMSELFGNDKAAYEQALDVINRAESEQAAFNWLRERLWVTEDHSDAAMIFFDVVRRFKNG